MTLFLIKNVWKHLKSYTAAIYVFKRTFQTYVCFCAGCGWDEHHVRSRCRRGEYKINIFYICFVRNLNSIYIHVLHVNESSLRNDEQYCMLLHLYGKILFQPIFFRQNRPLSRIFLKKI